MIFSLLRWFISLTCILKNNYAEFFQISFSTVIFFCVQFQAEYISLEMMKVLIFSQWQITFLQSYEYWFFLNWMILNNYVDSKETFSLFSSRKGKSNKLPQNQKLSTFSSVYLQTKFVYKWLSIMWYILYRLLITNI